MALHKNMSTLQDRVFPLVHLKNSSCLHLFVFCFASGSFFLTLKLKIEDCSPRLVPVKHLATLLSLN